MAAKKQRIIEKSPCGCGRQTHTKFEEAMTLFGVGHSHFKTSAHGPLGIWVSWPSRALWRHLATHFFLLLPHELRELVT
jgi:hypothetical protein